MLNKKKMTSSVLRYFYVRCLIFGILPSLVLIFFKNLPSFKIGAYRLVLIKHNACNFLIKWNKTKVKKPSILIMFSQLPWTCVNPGKNMTIETGNRGSVFQLFKHKSLPFIIAKSSHIFHLQFHLRCHLWEEHRG